MPKFFQPRAVVDLDTPLSYLNYTRFERTSYQSMRIAVRIHFVIRYGNNLVSYATRCGHHLREQQSPYPLPLVTSNGFEPSTFMNQDLRYPAIGVALSPIRPLTQPVLDANSNIVDADYERGYRAGNDLTSYTDFTTKLRVVTAFLNFQIYI